MEIAIKALAGAIVVAIIQLLSRAKNAYIAGLVPLFPTFALIVHYLVGTERGTIELKRTIRFGMWSLIPYLVYLAAMYWLVDRFSLRASLLLSTACWLGSAAILIWLWNRM
jgi:uncharacterized membrane protein (GlpM family)